MGFINQRSQGGTTLDLGFGELSCWVYKLNIWCINVQVKNIW